VVLSSPGTARIGSLRPLEHTNTITTPEVSNPVWKGVRMPTVLDTDVDLGDVDVGSDQALADLARGHELLRRRAEGLLLQSLVDIDRCGLYRANGYTDVAAWGRGELRWEPGEARSRRGLTKLAQEVPEIVDRLLAGRLGVAQAHLLGRLFSAPRVGRHVPEFIDSFLHFAAEMSYHHFEHYCRSWRLLMDQDGTLPNRAGRHASLAFTDTEYRLTIVGPAIDGAAWQAELQHLERIEFEHDWQAAKQQYGDAVCHDLLPRTNAQRRYDALQRLVVGRPASDLAGDLAGGSSGGVSTVVNIVADLPTWLHQLDRISGIPGVAPQLEPFGPARGRSHTIDGTQVHPRDVVLASLANHVRCVVTDSTGRAVAMTSKQRLFTGPLADAIRLTSTTCTHPGCLAPVSTSQLDHLVPHSRGGPTSVVNGGPACDTHNPWRYATGVRTSLRDDGVWITEYPDGTRIAPPD
jgi:hypothetical protein